MELSVLRDLLVGTCRAALGLRHRPRPGGLIHGASYLCHTVGMGQSSEATLVISPLVLRTLSRKSRLPSLSLKTILALTWLNGGSQTSWVVGTVLVSLRGSASSSTFTPTPRSSPRHPPAYPRARSHLPVTITREDKWPHSGTPCQICLSKTKLCAALREKWLAAAQ